MPQFRAYVLLSFFGVVSQGASCGAEFVVCLAPPDWIIAGWHGVFISIVAIVQLLDRLGLWWKLEE